MPAKPALKATPRSQNFYLRTFRTAEQMLRELQSMEGVDHEIELLRSHLKQWVTDHPKDLHVLLPVIRLIVHAVATRHKIAGPAQQALYQQVAAVLATVGQDLAADGGDDAPPTEATGT